MLVASCKTMPGNMTDERTRISVDIRIPRNIRTLQVPNDTVPSTKTEIDNSGPYPEAWDSDDNSCEFIPRPG